MKKVSFWCVRMAFLLMVFGAAWPAQAVIYWRISINVILGPENQWPSSTNDVTLGSEADIRQEIVRYNALLDRMGWGYRFELVGVTELTHASKWFNADARDGANLIGLENEAKLPNNWSSYNWRIDAINVYINNSASGVSTGFPYTPIVGNGVLIGVAGSFPIILHEFGHDLDLNHTHGPCNDPSDCGNVWRNDDRCADTVFDFGYKSLNEVAQYNFQNSFSNLFMFQREQVLNVFDNVMSYHQSNGGKADRLTHDQWQILVDSSNDPLKKRHVCSGSTVFVNATAVGLSPCELAGQLAGLVESLPGPVSWYTDELNLHPPGPENNFRRTCNSFSINPAFPPRPPGVPDDWEWPPPLNLGRPPGFPSDWPWPLEDPVEFSICLGGAYKTVQKAIDCAAQDGDRVQIAAGSYPERMTIRKRLTLVAEGGRVIIGKP
jgi:hypothetical protein